MKESALLCMFATVLFSTVSDFLILFVRKISLLHKYSPLLALVSGATGGIRAAREEAVAVVELVLHTLLDKEGKARGSSHAWTSYFIFNFWSSSLFRSCRWERLILPLIRSEQPHRLL